MTARHRLHTFDLCCHGDCSQGRECPARRRAPDDIKPSEDRDGLLIVCVVGVFVVAVLSAAAVLA
jgi:hypothetical protein